MYAMHTVLLNSKQTNETHVRVMLKQRMFCIIFEVAENLLLFNEVIYSFAYFDAMVIVTTSTVIAVFTNLSAQLEVIK
jgi:hypothetical protein